MKIYQSSITYRVIKELKQRYLSKLPEKKPINTLISYGVQTGDEYKIVTLESDDNEIEIGLDSGAYSLNSRKSGSGIPITRKGYEIYAKKIKSLVKVKLQLNFDSDFTAKGTIENYKHLKVLEKAGLEITPVIHDYYGDEIKFYIDQGYEMIALGSIFDPVRKKQIRTAKDVKYGIEEAIRLNCKIKIHVLGLAAYNDPSRWPIYSSDAANWTHNVTYGFILWWNDDKNSYDKTDKVFFEDFNHQDPQKTYFRQYEYRRELEEYLDQKLGLTYEDLMGFDKDHYRQVVNSLYYLVIEDKIAEEHRRRGFLY